MANYDFVMPYEAPMEAWLIQQRLPHPKVSPQNRFPNKQEILEAIANSGTLCAESADEEEFFAIRRGASASGEYAVRIGCSNWDRVGECETDSITMHGDFEVELFLVEMLSRKCGQLLLYPDTGEPAVIVQAGMDLKSVLALYENALLRDDRWEYFYSHMEY